MGTIMIRCPSTGPAISTGKEVASAAVFRSMAVFLAEHSPRCKVTRENAQQREYSVIDMSLLRASFKRILGRPRRRIWGVQRTRRGAGERSYHV